MCIIVHGVSTVTVTTYEPYITYMVIAIVITVYIHAYARIEKGLATLD